MLWWRNWKVKKINLSHILSTSRHFFPEYVVQYYLYERKDDGDKIFVCNHTWSFFLSFMAKCLALHFFSFHFHGVRAIKPINSTTTGDLQIVIALASKESLCVYGQYEAQENINFLRISWFMNFLDPVFINWFKVRCYLFCWNSNEWRILGILVLSPNELVNFFSTYYKPVYE